MVEITKPSEVKDGMRVKLKYFRSRHDVSLVDAVVAITTDAWGSTGAGKAVYMLQDVKEGSVPRNWGTRNRHGFKHSWHEAYTDDVDWCGGLRVFLADLEEIEAW